MSNISSNVKKVQKSAKDYGGTCTQQFSQCTNPVAQIISKLPSTKNGICMMLAGKWIGELAKGGSMWDSIYFGGHFNAASIITVMHNFIDDEVQNLNWDYVRKQYFKQHGVKHISAQAEVGNKNAASADIGNHLATAINAAGALEFISLDIYGPGGAHSVAAWNGINQFLYFDPNYGEFHFTDKAKFNNWLKAMGNLSDYRNKFGSVRSDTWKKG